MKYFLLIGCWLIASISHAQTEDYVQPGKESLRYHDYRAKITVPPYGLQKVNALIASIKTKQEDNEESGTEALSDEKYNTLSLKEKFTYNMIHGEDFSQNCDAFMPVEGEQNKIFAHTPDGFFGENYWSERQLKFFKDNRDSVIALMTESVIRSKRIGCNYKLAIKELNAVEMIPFLISMNRTIQKDHDILTVLMELMVKNKYEPFMKSVSYEKLYSENADYSSYLNYNKENEDLILKRATDFLHEYRDKNNK